MKIWEKSPNNRCKYVSIFTRNPRGGKAKQLDQNDINKFLNLAKENKFAKLLAHAPYTLNACAADESKREVAVNTFIDDLKD